MKDPRTKEPRSKKKQFSFREKFLVNLKTIILPLIFALAFFVTSLLSINNLADTNDESRHFVRGIMLLKTGDYRLNQHHPVLFNVIPAVPGLFDKDLKTEPTTSENWIYAKKDSMAGEIVRLNGGSLEFAPTNLFYPRLLLIVIATGFIFGFYSLINKHFGFIPAVVSTFLLTFDPTFLAHSRLVTTDMGATVTIFLATFCLFLFLSKPEFNKKLFIAFIITSFLALITKYTAIIAAAGWILAIIGKTIFQLKSLKGKWVKSILQLFGQLFIIAISWVIMMWAAYGFHLATLKDMVYDVETKIADDYKHIDRITTEGNQVFGEALGYVYDNVPLPSPQYIRGFIDNVVKHNYYGHSTFFMGEFSNGGWWYYFPVAFLIKEPITTILLTVMSLLIGIIALVNALKKKVRFKPEYLAFVIPIFLITYTSLKSSINLGIRHLLPLLPFLFLFIGIMVTKVLEKWTYTRYIVSAFFTFLLISVYWQYPFFIEYFNESIGGPQNGYHYIRDSNLDWDQNQILATNYINEHADFNATASPSEVLQTGGILVTRVEKFYGNPEKKSEEMKQLNQMYEDGEIELIGKISNTHLIFYVPASN